MCNSNSTTKNTLAKNFYLAISLLFLYGSVNGQHQLTVNATLNDSLKTLYIQQEIVYYNSSDDNLEEIYLNDWINAFSGKRTPLARRFFEDYDRDFHFAGPEKRGHTTLNTLIDSSKDSLSWERPSGYPDLIRIALNEPLEPRDSLSMLVTYQVKIPSSEFTSFGYTNNGKYQLRYWFLTPGVYQDGWQVQSHKNMGDLYIPKMDLDIRLRIPDELAAISSYEVTEIVQQERFKIVRLKGTDRLETDLYLTPSHSFEEIETNNIRVLTNITENGLSPVLKSVFVKRIIDFLEDHLGTYPHRKILSTQQRYASSPVYGLNQLPGFLRPYPEGFNYELKQLKTLSESFLQNSIMLNRREKKWIFDAIQTYLMMEYMKENYPDLKMLGSLSDVIGIRWFHAADLDFNEQYPLLYLYMARQNMDQALSTPQDSLIKFNKNLANPYKAGAGFRYLDAFLEDETVSYTIKSFFEKYKLEPVRAEDFKEMLKRNAGKDISWFFKNYIGTNDKIDFKIRKVKRHGDSLEVTIKNKTGNEMPISLFGLRDGEVVYKKWVEHIQNTKTVYVPSRGVKKFALNYDGVIPEINQRDNYKKVSGLFHKPLQFRLLKDVEDPRYTQVFLMPHTEYNLYDGLSVGAQIYNNTILRKNFEYSISPLYATRSSTLVGSAAFTHEIFFQDQHLHSIRYGASGSRFSYGYDLFYERFTPFLTMSFTDSPLRSSQKEFLVVRNVNVYRDQNLESPLEVPDYSVFNINYSYKNPGLVDYVLGSVDLQVAEQFGKSSFTLEYRKLLNNNRQLNVRFFGGAFFYNDLPESDYFSFALDRPTDYLFDYNYYGRSETSGIFSQQIIMAEGGFKSSLETKYANQWITTLNGNTTIWKWVFAYADIGLVKNRDTSPKFLYDSGIRASIVQDYFEVFFPVYSSNGWEIGQGNYDQKIRFIATLDFKTLVAIFSREWY